ncbi:MAG: DUF4835 family protein, partial [Hymenobacteraceae bacterium]|nr:DUF4835 family protein [Hymenobacteraceae bacterium]
MLKYLISFLLVLCALAPAKAQELQCDVAVNVVISGEQAAQVSPQLSNEMQNVIFDFMNNRRWTNEIYKLEERIKCKLFITITGVPEVNKYRANVQITSSRPVYGTAYETTLFYSIDKDWLFEYNPAQPLQYAENTYTSNLSSLLSFYAYTIIGYDKDSFARFGGSSAYDRALNIMNNTVSQADPGPGWKAFEDNTRNRYWMLTNLLDPQMQPFREAIFQYHRLGLDLMATNPQDARTAILEALQKVQTVARLKPGAAILRAFFEAKSNEIVSIFKNATPEQKQTVVSVMSSIDPTNTAKYQTIL